MKNKYAYRVDVFELHKILISKIIEVTGCELYLELGVLQGLNIKEASKYCKNCIGVDMVDKRIFKEFEFHLKSTDEFFKDFNKKPNIIFIDADHHFEQVKKDFSNSLSCLSDHGIIFLHDTDPIEEKYIAQNYCGDTYKITDWIKIEYPELDIITLPIAIAGLSIVVRNKDRRVLKFI